MAHLELTARDRKFIGEVSKVVREHLADHEFNVTGLCAFLGLSRATVHRRLKATINQNTSEFIRSLRLQHAAILLKEEACSVRQAARESGFNNLSYFSKCFREQFGVSPSEFPER